MGVFSSLLFKVRLGLSRIVLLNAFELGFDAKPHSDDF
jgi:hypothetical protein